MKMKRHKSIKKCHSLLQSFLLRFSAAGVGRIHHSRGRLRRITWSIMVLGTLFLMSYMTYKVIKEYFEYKKTVERTHVILNSMKFPAVTICSTITLPRSRADVAGVEHLIRMEDFLSNIRRYKASKEDRKRCNVNPACVWSWFEDKCKCLSNPCECEYCERGYPTCACSSMLCNQYPKTCLHSQTDTTDTDDDCFCRNRTLDIKTPYEEDEFSNPDNSVLENITDVDVRNLISVIRHAQTDDLSDMQWAFQPNIYNIANYGTSFDNLIIGCNFQKQTCDKRDFTVLYTASHGKCYSFNYAGQFSKYSKPVETKRYGWTSGLQLYLQIRDDEIINLLSKDIGVIVVVHDPHELPYVSEYGLTVRAGDSASLRVQRSSINRLGSPWGDCLTSGKHLPFNYSDIPYSQLGCQRYCQNYYINQNCKCYKRSLLAPSVRRPKENSMDNLCNFTTPSQRLCADEIIEQIENETIQCNCFQACSEEIYQTSLTAGTANKKFYQLVKAAKTLRTHEDHYITTFASNKTNILGLRVYYGTLSLQNITERPAYSWETLIANIGGNLGFFMGLTLITFLEVAELFCDLFLFIFKTK